jgi:hypothetical protein
VEQTQRVVRAAGKQGGHRGDPTYGIRCHAGRFRRPREDVNLSA